MGNGLTYLKQRAECERDPTTSWNPEDAWVEGRHTSRRKPQSSQTHSSTGSQGSLWAPEAAKASPSASSLLYQDYEAGSTMEDGPADRLAPVPEMLLSVASQDLCSGHSPRKEFSVSDAASSLKRGNAQSEGVQFEACYDTFTSVHPAWPLNDLVRCFASVVKQRHGTSGLEFYGETLRLTGFHGCTGGHPTACFRRGAYVIRIAFWRRPYAYGAMQILFSDGYEEYIGRKFFRSKTPSDVCDIAGRMFRAVGISTGSSLYGERVTGLQFEFSDGTSWSTAVDHQPREPSVHQLDVVSGRLIRIKVFSGDDIDAIELAFHQSACLVTQTFTFDEAKIQWEVSRVAGRRKKDIIEFACRDDEEWKVTWADGVDYLGVLDWLPAPAEAAFVTGKVTLTGTNDRTNRDPEDKFMDLIDDALWYRRKASNRSIIIKREAETDPVVNLVKWSAHAKVRLRCQFHCRGNCLTWPEFGASVDATATDIFEPQCSDQCSTKSDL